MTASLPGFSGGLAPASRSATTLPEQEGPGEEA